MSSHDETSAARASFTTMDASTAEDWQIIATQFLPYARALPDRVLAHLRMLEGDCGGFAVDRLMHSLQTATRAQRDGRDEEYVVCALLHDIGENHWMVEKHAIFQGYYFFHHIGGDRNVREQFRSHEWFGRTEEFCARYDGPAFNPSGETLPLAFFEPMLRRVFAQPRRSLYARVSQAR